jgi:hypothetical protein
VAEKLDFGGYADGEERQDDHGNGEAREALGEAHLVPSMAEVDWLAGTAIQLLLLVLTRLKYCSEVAIFSSYILVWCFACPLEKASLNQGCVMKVPRFRRSNNGAKVSKSGTNSSSFEREEMRASNAISVTQKRKVTSEIECKLKVIEGSD